ncbi:MAG: phosphate/phosphite/phosphonate ABC transporter substrate-binding protein [Burkholderiaceae bacterium]
MKNTATPFSIQRRRLGVGVASVLALPLLTQVATRAAASSHQPAKVLRLAVVPQLTPVELSKAWSPIVQALAQIGIACELTVHPSIEEFETEFMQGKADIVYLNPYHMVMAKRAHRYEPLVRDKRPLQGVLLVKNEGPIKTIEQLKGQRISFPAPNAFAASLYVRAILERQYRLTYEPHYAFTHRNAVRQVLAGDSAAAGIVKTTFEGEPPEVRQALRVIYSTPEVPPHPIAVHPRISADVRKKISDLLLDMAKDPVRKPLMQGILMPDPLRARYEQDYEPLEQLKIESFVKKD